MESMPSRVGSATFSRTLLYCDAARTKALKSLLSLVACCGLTSFSESSACRQDSMRACSLAARSCSACCCDVSGVVSGFTCWREAVLLQPANNIAASGIIRRVSEIFTISVHEVDIFSTDSKRLIFILQYITRDILLFFSGKAVSTGLIYLLD